MSRKKAEFKVAKTFGEIVNDRYSLYAVYVKPRYGCKIKRHLVKGSVDTYGRIKLTKYNVFGNLINSWWSDDLIVTRNLQDTTKAKTKSVVANYNTVFYTSKEEVYNTVLHQLRLDKLSINKQIIDLQKELYAVE